MVNLDVEPDENGIRIRCAEVAVLLSLKHKGPLVESELKKESCRRNYNNSLILEASKSSGNIKRSFNHIISRNISKGHIEKRDQHKLSEKTKFRLTNNGVEYTNRRFERILECIKSD